MWAGQQVLRLLQDLFKQGKLLLTLTLSFGDTQYRQKGGLQTVSRQRS